MLPGRATDSILYLEDMPAGIIGISNCDVEAELRLFFNPNAKEEIVKLPAGEWDVYICDDIAGIEPIADEKL